MSSTPTGSTTRRFETNDGCGISFVDRGGGDGVPTVLVHGFAACSDTYADLIDALAPDRRVLAPDYRGHGRSDRPPYGYRVPRFAVDLRELLDHVGLRQVDLVVHSMGCAVAWSYIDMFGVDSIRRLVLADCEPWTMKLWDNEHLGLMAPGALAELTTRMREQWSGNREQLLRETMTGDVGEEIFAASLEWSGKLGAEAAAQLTYNFASSDWRDVLPRITVPTLVIGAARSFVPQGAVTWVSEMIPDARMVRFEEAAHPMMLEEPEGFNALVKDFLGEDE